MATTCGSSWLPAVYALVMLCMKCSHVTVLVKPENSHSHLAYLDKVQATVCQMPPNCLTLDVTL